MTKQKSAPKTPEEHPARPQPTKPLRFYATAAFNEKYLVFLPAFAAVVTAHFHECRMDLYIFENGPAGTIKVRVNGYEFGRRQSRDVSFALPPMAGPMINKFWCKIDEHDDQFVALFLFPSEY